MRASVILFAITSLCLATPSLGAAPACTKADIQKWAAGVQVQAAFMHPKMMAIGDSLFNGVTSLSIGPALADHNVPALVARSLGIAGEFRKAVYPRFVMWDFESELSRPLPQLLADGPTGRSLGHDMSDSIKAWQKAYPINGDKEQPFFDNIAIAGATSESLLCETQQDLGYWVTAPVTSGTLDIPDPVKAGEPFSDWFFDINDGFVLNPSGDKQYSKLSQMAEVVARQPGRLLINIGSNDGVWLMAFRGYAPDTQYPVDPGNPSGPKTTINAQLDQLVQNMKMIAELVPATTKYVYLDNLIPPSRTANLDPTLYPQICTGVPASPPYFATYEPYISDQGIKTVRCAAVRKMDAAVCFANKRIYDAMSQALGRRLVIVDLNGMLWKYDHKDLAGGAAPAGSDTVPRAKAPTRPVKFFAENIDGEQVRIRTNRSAELCRRRRLIQI